MPERKPQSAAQAARPEDQPRARRRSDSAAIATLVLAHLAFFWRAAILRGVLIHSDICFFFEPAKAFLHDSLRAGRLPLWSPYIFCGYPLAAEGQAAAFYPVSLLISWLLPSFGAVNWLVISHLIVAAVSMYLLARALGAPPFAAWLAALTYSFSGYLFAHSHHVSLLCAASLFPLVILFVERAWRGSTLVNSVLAAASWAALALCGHPQTLFHVSLVVAFWIAWRWVQANRARETGQNARALTIAAITFLLGAALSAIQLLPTAQLAAAAPHGENGEWAYVTSFSLLPKHLLGMIAPNWQGSMAFNTYEGEPYYWEYVLYIGIAPLALAILGGARRRGWVIGAVALAALAMALGTVNPLYYAIRFLPGFASFRVPARYILVFTFAAALLVAMGWQTVSGWRWAAQGRRLLVLGALVVLLIAADLLRFDRTLAPLADTAALATPSPAAEAMQRDRGWWRAIIVQPTLVTANWSMPSGWVGDPDGWARIRALLPADVPQSYGIRVTTGYAAFEDACAKLFFDAAYGGAQAGDLRLVSLVGLKYLALPPQVTLPGLVPQPVGQLALFRNPGAFPRIFSVSQIVLAKDGDDAHMQTMALADGSRLDAAAVVEGQMMALNSPGKPHLEASVREPRPERIIIDATSDRDCLLVLNERHDSGWQVQVDGKRSSLLSVDTVLMGTPLPKGKHRVEFHYQPGSFLVGRAISAAALLAALALIIAGAAAGSRARAAGPVSAPARR